MKNSVLFPMIQPVVINLHVKYDMNVPFYTVVELSLAKKNEEKEKKRANKG